MFGITITAVGCLEGLSTGAGAEQVGRSTTQAVVKSIFLVVVVDLFFTVLFFFAVTDDGQNKYFRLRVLNPCFHCANLRVSYGEREILHGISFDVVRGETLVILGGSGSGKSTLLRTLVGLEKPSAGEIWIKGQDLAKTSAEEMDEIRRQIGMSFQGGALFGSMTVGENVALPLREHTKLEDSTIEIILR